MLPHKLALILPIAAASNLFAALSIDIDFANTNAYYSSNTDNFVFQDVGSFNGKDYSGHFNAALNYWNGALVDYADTSYTGGAITLYGGMASLSDAFNDTSWDSTLGIGSYTNVGFSNALYVTEGTIVLNTDEIGTYSDDLIFQVLVHEIGHSLGFGEEMWWNYDLYDSDLASGEYLGEIATATYASEFGQTGATYVPVEIDSGEGSDHSHWSQDESGTDSEGRYLSGDIMTAYASGSPYMSDTSLATFEDIAYVVDYSYAGELNFLEFVPEPSSTLLVSISGAFLILRRKRA